MNLYVTADRIGLHTGGGMVTGKEYKFLTQLAELDEETHPVDASRISVEGTPFEIDRRFHDTLASSDLKGGRLAHFYAGCFSKTIQHLKKLGMKVSYTAAAHDIHLSREEYEGLGIPFDYPHLNSQDLWERYIEGYRLADLVICPSNLSAELMKRQLCKNVTVIPHGIEPVTCVPPLPKRFAVGYFGALGPDKGVRYLLEAWKRLNYKDATLVLGGRASVHAPEFVRRFGGGNVHIVGEVKDLADFYRLVSVYVQPSVTEGFGIEVVEAMAHGRPVICSEGAGAVDAVIDGHNGFRFGIRQTEKLMSLIDKLKNDQALLERTSAIACDEGKARHWSTYEIWYLRRWGQLFEKVA